MSFESVNSSEDLVDVVFDQETKVLSVPMEIKTECRGLGYEFYILMRKFQDNIAQYNADTGISHTYGEILQQATRVALKLKERNLTKDDVVCLCSYNHSYNIIPLLASLFLNVKVSSLDPSFGVMDAVPLLRQIKPKICFVIPEAVEVFVKSLEEVEVEADIIVYDNIDDYNTNEVLYLLNNRAFRPFSEFLKEHQHEQDFIPEETEGSETCCIYFSSGSSGLPKGVCLSHRYLLHSALGLEAKGTVDTKPSVALVYSGFYWISAIINLSLCFVTGSARIVCKAFDPVKFWKIIELYRVTYAFLTPIQAYSIISANRPENVDTTSLTLVATGGSHFAIESMYKLRDLLPGTFVDQMYGMTESGVMLDFNIRRIKDRLCLHKKPDSCGRPVIGYQYKVVNLETKQPCGLYERGELRVKSQFLFNKYHEINFSECFDEEGFFKTGDVAYFDEEFCFFIVDRIKELLKYKNWQISPALIEQVLQTHPAVIQAIVIGLSHKTDGDYPMALVIPREDHAITTDSLKEYANERLNDVHQLRGGVKFVEDIPLTPSGKVKRNELKAMVLNGLV